MKFKLGELFCGPGGIALGAKNAEFTYKSEKYSIEHTWASDYDLDTCKTYTRNICPNAPETVIYKDVRELDIDSLKKINCFAYGFPCNDFSVVGERQGINGKFGPLYTYGIKIIEQFNPKFFLAENVGGISSANSGDAFKIILKALKNAGKGYSLTAHLYKSEQYGISQTRHRIVIVGIRKDLKLNFKVPAPTTPNENDYVPVQRVLEESPIPKNAINNELTNQSKVVIERLKYIKPGENVWTASLPKHLELNVKGARLSQIYKRLDPNKPSYTITGSGGGGTHGYHWKYPRALTNRERARIQTFPDDYIFMGSKESVRKQIGMAVPPDLAKIIFEAILNTFAGKKYKHVRASIDI